VCCGLAPRVHASAPGGFMMPNDFTSDKAKKLFSKLWIKFSRRRDLAETGDLLRLSAGVRRRHVVSCLQNSNFLGKPEALRQHVDDRGIYIVDTAPYVLKLGHGGGAVDITHLMIRLFDLRHECSKHVPISLEDSYNCRRLTAANTLARFGGHRASPQTNII
jgi:hypothetical protein